MTKSAIWLGGFGREIDQYFDVLMCMLPGHVGFNCPPDGGRNFWKESADKEQWLIYSSQISEGFGPYNVYMNPIGWTNKEYLWPGTAAGLGELGSAQMYPYGIYDVRNKTYAWQWGDRAANAALWLNKQFGANVIGIMADSINADWWFPPTQAKKPPDFDAAVYRTAQEAWVKTVKESVAQVAPGLKLGGNLDCTVENPWPKMWELLDVVLLENRRINQQPDANISDPKRTAVVAVNPQAVETTYEGKPVPISLELQTREMVALYSSLMRDGDLIVSHGMRDERTPLV